MRFCQRGTRRNLFVDFRDLFYSGGNMRHDYANDEFDKAILAAAHELDDKKRMALYTLADTVLLCSGGAAPLYYIALVREIANKSSGETRWQKLRPRMDGALRD